jgi:hypothetical protein
MVTNVTEARSLLSPLQGKEGVIGEVNGIFRTLKDVGPSLEVDTQVSKS